MVEVNLETVVKTDYQVAQVLQDILAKMENQVSSVPQVRPCRCVTLKKNIFSSIGMPGLMGMNGNPGYQGVSGAKGLPVRVSCCTDIFHVFMCRVYLAHRVIQVSPDDVENRVHQVRAPCHLIDRSIVMFTLFRNVRHARSQGRAG